MATSKKTVRSLVAIGLAIGLVAAACGGSKGTGGNSGGGGNAGGTGSLNSGLAANLDQLNSYQYSWTFNMATAGTSAAGTGGFSTSGTVINKPAKAYKINDLGMLQIIAIGDKAWTSFDNGNTWTVDTTYTVGSSDLNDLLPMHDYTSWFDTNAGQFHNAGSETKNGIDCVHYAGSTDLGAQGAALGVSGSFHADLWVAKNGNYPVSGFYGWTASSGGESGTFGYSFDITHVNDAAANVVTAPTNVTP